MDKRKVRRHGRSVEAAARAPVTSGGYLIAEARQRAGLAQAELAERLGTSQSLVARWETGRVTPSFRAVVRAARACELELSVGLSTYDAEHDILIADQLRLTPEQRARKMLAHVAALVRLQTEARRADG
ncbi:MAG: helix-turn-helix domain-containing protein [Actinomycetota bacterium]